MISQKFESHLQYLEKDEIHSSWAFKDQGV
jgi:hypothetical protein